MKFKHTPAKLVLRMLKYFQYWHKGCFKCETCSLTLSLKTYKGYNKLPYCNVWVAIIMLHILLHIITLLLHIIMIKQQLLMEYYWILSWLFVMECGVQRSYFSHYPVTHFTAVADTPENRRLKKQTDNLSLVSFI